MENRLANTSDLERELWLRERNSGQIIWKTKEGKVIPIKEMTSLHIKNVIGCLKVSEIKEELATGWEDIGAADWEYDG